VTIVGEVWVEEAEEMAVIMLGGRELMEERLEELP
jgi:hypothetical protein